MQCICLFTSEGRSKALRLRRGSYPCIRPRVTREDLRVRLTKDDLNPASTLQSEARAEPMPSLSEVVSAPSWERCVVRDGCCTPT